MTAEQLEQFGKGAAFIDMKGTTEDDWINLVEQCANVGIDLNKRAEKYYGDWPVREYGPVQPFVYYQRAWNDEYRYLKCTHTALASYGANTTHLMIHTYEPGDPKDMPVFEV